MNKKDLPLIILLFALLILWPRISNKVFPKPPVTQPAAATNQVDEAQATQAGSNIVAIAAPPTNVSAPRAAAVQPTATVTGAVSQAAAPAVEDNASFPWRILGEVSQHAEDQPTLRTLSNNVLEVTVSSWGGAITSARLRGDQYPQSNDPNSGPLVMDLGAMPSLSYAALPGFSTNYDFDLAVSANSIHVSRTNESGLLFERTITFGDGHEPRGDLFSWLSSLTSSGTNGANRVPNCELKIVDRFTNVGQTPADLPIHGINLSEMRQPETFANKRGPGHLGIDAQALFGGERAEHWSKKFGNLFMVPGQKKGFMCMPPSPPPTRPQLTAHISRTNRTEWVAVKNKFFTQFLAANGEESAACAFTMHLTREMSDAESKDPDNPSLWPRMPTVDAVAATMHFPKQELEPGESFSRSMSYYVGPKQHSVLSAMGKEEVMELGWTGGVFGWLGWLLKDALCPFLIWLMNTIFRILPNYGVAIILVTIIVRLIFWPIMQKSTENMKKMQALQPALKELREKHKNDQRKQMQMQQELFKEHKVSPLGGCLPMLVQIPVFIGLFTVLRSAVQLRFAHFLWIRDLSEPERIFEFGFALPLLGWDALNLLPLLMSATMFWQQKITPTAGDPQQQKMMGIFMPIMLLAVFYNMASALVLYWTVSQGLSILQLVLKNKKEKQKELEASAALQRPSPGR